MFLSQSLGQLTTEHDAVDDNASAILVVPSRVLPRAKVDTGLNKDKTDLKAREVKNSDGSISQVTDSESLKDLKDMRAAAAVFPKGEGSRISKSSSIRNPGEENRPAGW